MYFNLKGPQDLFLMFDVESIGLHGEGFAVGYTVRSLDKRILEEGMFSCPIEAAEGTEADRDWILDNVPALTITHTTPKGVRDAFWEVWMRWSEKKVCLVSDCNWPVETNFLSACINDDPEARRWKGPYPMFDLTSVLATKNEDPLATRDRQPDELPAHHPLADARQSARLLLEAL